MVVAALAAVLVALVLMLPAQVLPALTIAFPLLYLISSIDRNILMFKGIGSEALVSVSEEDALALSDDDLPVYTVLLPVYREPAIVQNLLVGVGNLNYPPTNWKCCCSPRKTTSPPGRHCWVCHSTASGW